MVRHHVRSFGNNKIMAIKLVRELACCGLAEAKELVESCSGFFVRADADSQARITSEAKRYSIDFDPPLDGIVAPLADPAVDESGYSVRFVSGARLIHAIKLVRECTGLGLADAKDVVDKATLIRSGLSLTDAEALARRFAQIDARVELLAPGATAGSSFGSSAALDDEADDDF